MNRLQKEPVLVSIPEVPAIPAVPAYCVTETLLVGMKPVAGTGSRSGSRRQGVPYLDANGNVSYIGAGAGGSVGGGSGSLPVYQSQITCFPAVSARAAVPARTDAYASIGWNAGARSSRPLPQDGYFQCRIPLAPAGIVIGLSDGSYEHAYGQVSHGIVFRKTGMVPISHGTNLAETADLVPGALVRFERSDGVIKAFVDGELFHTFATPLFGTVFADVTLYGMADYVDEPEIGKIPTGIEGRAPAWAGTISAEPYCYLDGRAPFPLIEITSRMLTGISRVAPAAVGFVGARKFSGVSSRAPVPLFSARSGSPEAVETGILGYGAAPQMAIRSMVGVQGGIGGQAPAPAGYVSNVPSCGIDSDWVAAPRMTVWIPYLQPGVVDGGDKIFAADFGRLDDVVLFLAYDHINLSDTVDLVLLVSMEAYDYIGIGDQATLGGVIRLLAMERVAINSSASTAKREALQYAVNVVTGALSTYQNFGFTQFATAGGETYAIRPDALYCLRGDTDDGETLRAAIDFGASDYGTAQAKRIGSVYAGVTTDGEVYVRLTGADGVERRYRAVGAGDELRAPVAKGVTARHWRLRLEITDATYADLDNIEVGVGASQRRLRSTKR
ncbi:hypothetical protein SAMN05216588_101194 [Pseudomonas flavescens]|uniref:Uncharacterized protein n=1 Tax=Phytopseudomonas flavescens TaxID=29435 RepID=A0A1G7XMC3_9GAMM|nr:hypothetical protein [Pseudomonas flavescens]SDG85398.1 hypothetical protein SAMN05216588_101194 [Pseudomonas flavescens]